MRTRERVMTMTRRERKERKAQRLREWAEKRQAKAASLEAANAPLRGDIAFATQPGHIPERARYIARAERAYEHTAKAAEMEQRAAGIERQAERTIYSDDSDAIERLEERIEELEAKRAEMKARNARLRKEHGKSAGLYEAYEFANLGSNIRRLRQRLATLKGAAS